ncbi:MAG TPA: choice-of-anchor tandem repeat GloVer-containing protein [Terriglobales bacterium]|nr:choice-of-anchor tandem repeat GloVer-containing protein [Terriglobales bacterium]
MKTTLLWLSFMILGCVLSLGQTQEKVLYSFCAAQDCSDGGPPAGSVVPDHAGNLYGTTSAGGEKCLGIGGCGTVYELSPNSDGSWTHTLVYNFCSQADCHDGQFPMAGLIFDSAGNLYGTTSRGGMYENGTVFMLSPPLAPGGSWTETVLWSFSDFQHGDGCKPAARLTFDSAGNLYGTTNFCLNGVFQLVPPPQGQDQWTENILYGVNDGYAEPFSEVIFHSGNLYFTKGGKQPGQGAVIELVRSQSWEGETLYKFTYWGGWHPLSSVSFDKRGYLYGTMSEGGAGSCGGIFRLNLSGEGREENNMPFEKGNGCAPAGGLYINGYSAYGTTQSGGAFDSGTLFKINQNVESIIYNFCNQANCADGAAPNSDLISDGTNFIGVTQYGGAHGHGVVFEITP